MSIRRCVPHPTDPSLALVPLTKGHFAVISAADVTDAGKFNWFAQQDKLTVYARRRRRNADGTSTIESLHRRIAQSMGLSVASQVDHINGNGLDCRRSNLRDATHAQNARNAARRRDNTSGVKGVSWSHKRRKWVGRIRVDGRRLYAGFFETIEGAAAAVASMRAGLHGEFANDGRN